LSLFHRMLSCWLPPRRDPIEELSSGSCDPGRNFPAVGSIPGGHSGSQRHLGRPLPAAGKSQPVRPLSVQSFVWLGRNSCWSADMAPDRSADRADGSAAVWWAGGRSGQEEGEGNCCCWWLCWPNGVFNWNISSLDKKKDELISKNVTTINIQVHKGRKKALLKHTILPELKQKHKKN
jgi:hypothetical protein